MTEQFDTAAAPATGDFWRFGVAPLAASASYNLFVVNPGQTRSIALTITPTARRGHGGARAALHRRLRRVAAFHIRQPASGSYSSDAAPQSDLALRLPGAGKRAGTRYSSMVRRRIVTSMARSSSSTSSGYWVPMSVIT